MDRLQVIVNNTLYFKLVSQIVREIKQMEFWNIFSLLCGDHSTLVEVISAFLGTRSQFQYLEIAQMLSTTPRCYCSSLNVCASLHSIKTLGWEAENSLTSAISVLICGLNFSRDVIRHSLKCILFCFSCCSLVEIRPRRVSLPNYAFYGGYSVFM